MVRNILARISKYFYQYRKKDKAAPANTVFLGNRKQLKYYFAANYLVNCLRNSCDFGEMISFSQYRLNID